MSNLFIKGAEDYYSLKKYASDTFKELEEINETGFVIGRYHHQIKIISTSDWKAGSCIEGESNIRHRDCAQICEL